MFVTRLQQVLADVQQSRLRLEFYDRTSGNCPRSIRFMRSLKSYQKNNKNKVHHIPRGKALGGSSAINYMVSKYGIAQSVTSNANLTTDVYVLTALLVALDCR